MADRTSRTAVRLGLAVGLVAAIVVSAPPGLAQPASPRDQRLILDLTRTTNGPSSFHLEVGLKPTPSGGVMGSFQLQARRGRVLDAGDGSAFSFGRNENPHAYARGSLTSSCDAGVCDTFQTLVTGEGTDYGDTGGRGNATHFVVAVWGRDVAYTLDAKGWRLSRARLVPFRFRDDQEVDAVGAGAYGATVFMAAEAPGGRYGSVGIGIPPCSTANVSVGRGVGHATLTGGTRPQELTCPNFGETVTSWNPRATTWRFTGRMAGETTLVSTRLFVLDFTKAFLRSLR